MAQQDLSYVFQPVIHEPLSRPDVFDLSPTESKGATDAGHNTAAINADGTSAPQSLDHQPEEQREALSSIEEADRCRTNHPRKAMSLYLKAGKALVLCNQGESALKCFRSLILLATDQLTKVLSEKKNMAELRRSESFTETEKKEKENKKISRTKSCNIPPKRESTDLQVPDVRLRNCKSVTECTVDSVVLQESTQEDCCDFVSVEEVQCVDEDVGMVQVVECVDQEMCKPEEVTICEPVMEMGCQEEVPVFAVSEAQDITPTVEMTLACETTDNVCVVDCFEAEASIDFEVAMVESVDDSASNSGASTEDIVQTLNTEIVMMECNEVMMSAEEVPSNPQQNALIRRGYVVSELIDTEQNYIHDLNHVIKGYMAALSKEFNVPNELKGKEKIIFSNIKDIHEWHSADFFEELKICEDDPSKLGEVFTTAEFKLEGLYKSYCRSKPKSDCLVLPYKDTFFKDCRKRLGHRLQLPDYLIKPVQRITKYQLLLRDILKFTEKAGEDGSEIQRAIDVALRILKRTNDMISVAMIQGYDAKQEDTGELLLRETLEVAEGKYRQKSRERSVFLFEKIILITEPTEKECGITELRYLNIIKTHGLGQTETVDSDPCKWAVWLRKRSNAEIYVFKAPTADIKATWMKTIKECNERKKAPGILKSLYRSRTFRREEADTKEILDSFSPNLLTVKDPSKHDRKSEKRKSSKVITRKKKNRDSMSDRLKENIMRFRAEEHSISVEEEVPCDEPPNSLLTLGVEADLPQSPQPVQDAAEQLPLIEQRAKIEAEENQLNKVLLLTRLIAARLLQSRDSAEALVLYADVIASVLPLEELKKYEEIVMSRDTLLQHCTDVYEHWRKENLFKSGDIEEPYTSVTSLLSETAGFSSLHKGSVWSIVLYTVGAIASSREEKWRDASQAFYRTSLVYSDLQEPSCAVDSLLDAHWMCCQAGDYQGASNFFYNAFIRALASRDLIKCLRFEQQGLFLVGKLTAKDGNNNCDDDTEEENETRGRVSPRHLAFLINMSRATRRKDWAWFEFAESELNAFTSSSSGQQADAILSAVFRKLRKAMGEFLTGS